MKMWRGVGLEVGMGGAGRGAIGGREGFIKSDLISWYYGFYLV